jgi:putative ABC transport system permease protein
MAGAAGRVNSTGHCDAGLVMFAYGLELAIRSLRRNLMLTALMVAAVGVGIGASMTMLTTLVVMSSNPIPDKSSQLFIPQIDVTGYATQRHNFRNLPWDLTYRDAMAFSNVQGGVRQTAMYPLTLNVKPAQGDAFQASGRATYGDFFAMFEAPFRSGAAWGRNEDEARANVVVLSARLADRLFPDNDAVGRTVNLGNRDYRVSGVIRKWILTPHFYDFSAGSFGETEEFYMPFSIAVDRQLASDDYGCDTTGLPTEWQQRLDSECPWIQFWLEMPRAEQVRDFRTFLENYATEQRRLGRFKWLPLTTLFDVADWLTIQRVVPDEVRINTMIALGFLIVCLINAVGLMLAKFSSRAMELSVRRALGASRGDLFLQCVTEAMLIGLLGGLLGLGLTAVGLSALRWLRGVTDADSAYGRLLSLNVEMVLITFVVATVTTICCSLYPAFRASRVQPGWQLKAQ